jgi:hypothetical protein
MFHADLERMNKEENFLMFADAWISESDRQRQIQFYFLKTSFFFGWT